MRIRQLEKELDTTNTQLDTQQKLADKLKGRIDRIRSSAARVANRNPLIQRSNSSLSLASDQDEVLLMDQMSTTHTHAEQEQPSTARAPDRHQLNDMKKTMAQLQWPKRASFPSFDQYLGAINNTISTIRAQGVLPDIIALFLNNHLMASPLAAEYSVHAACHDANTIEGILEALKGCDSSYFLSKEEQFSRLMIGSNESAIGYMKRLETAFSELMTHDPINITAKNRRLKQQFFTGLEKRGFPKRKAEILMNNPDLQEIALQAEKDLLEVENQSRSNIGPHSHQNTSFQANKQPRPFRNNRNRPFHQPLMDQNTPSQQGHTSQQNGQLPFQEANTMHVVNPSYLSAPPNAVRAISNYETIPGNEQDVWCRKCRQMDHDARDCNYKKFCSFCDAEGHSDAEHRQNDKAQNYDYHPQNQQHQPQRNTYQQNRNQQPPQNQYRSFNGNNGTRPRPYGQRQSGYGNNQSSSASSNFRENQQPSSHAPPLMPPPTQNGQPRMNAPNAPQPNFNMPPPSYASQQQPSRQMTA